MTKKGKYLFLIILLLTVSGCNGQSIRSYHEEIKTQVPLYDKQNEQVLENLSVPPNVQQLAMDKQGVVDYSAYTRSLTVEYSSSETFENIFLFYESEMSGAGWKQLQRIENQWLIYYDLKTACLQIIKNPPVITTQPTTPLALETVYAITIWHDFFSQPFSVPTPTGINLCAEIFAGACHPCPPKPD